LRLAPGRNLDCIAQYEVVGFDFAGSVRLGVVVRFPEPDGQAVAFF
jgi:hypothetical protein